jgi:hypothetical protein
MVFTAHAEYMRIHAAALANMRAALLAPDKSLPSFDRVSIADRGK